MVQFCEFEICFLGLHKKFSLVLLQITNYIYSSFKKVKMNVICFKLFWYKAFVHWKLILLGLKWFTKWKSSLCEWFKKIMKRRIILPSIRRFEITQCQWFEKIMERRIFTQCHTRIQDKEVIWFFWQCQTINNYSYCLSLSTVFF